MNQPPTISDPNINGTTDPATPGMIEMTESEASARLDTDPLFADKLQSGQVRIIEKPGDSQNPNAATPQGTAAAEPKSDDEIEIPAFKVKKDLLGTYINGRTPQEAMIELLKGVPEKDRTIDFLKQSSGVGSLKKALEQFKTDPIRPAIVAPPEIDLGGDTDFDLSGLSGDNLFESENASKIIDVARGLLAKNKKLELALKKTNEHQRLAADQVAESAAAEGEVRLSKAATTIRHQMIESLAELDPSLKLTKPWALVDNEVDQFYDSVAKIAGVTDPNARGIALQTFFEDNGPQGDLLRAKVAEAKIAKPVDLERHQQIMSLDREREQYRRSIMDEMREAGVTNMNAWKLEDKIPSYQHILATKRITMKQPNNDAALLDALRKGAHASSAGSSRVVAAEPPVSGSGVQNGVDLNEDQMSQLLEMHPTEMNLDQLNAVIQVLEKVTGAASAQHYEARRQKSR
jgi:hypothetical protein